MGTRPTRRRSVQSPAQVFPCKPSGIAPIGGRRLPSYSGIHQIRHTGATMSHNKDKFGTDRFELEKRELEHLLRISERAQGVVAECNRVLAAKYQTLTENDDEAAQLAALLN